MDPEMPDLSLIISDHEFLVNRNLLINRSAYFKAMLEGGFKECNMNRVELGGMADPQAFALLLRYITGQEMDLVELSGKAETVLQMADMLGEESFPESLKKELTDNWRRLGTLREILEMGHCLNARSEVLCRIFQHIKDEFSEKGKALGRSEPYELSLNKDFVLEALQTEESTTFPFTEVYKLHFAKGIILWCVENRLDERNLPTVIQHLRLACIPECQLYEFLYQCEDGECRRTLERLIKQALHEIQSEISDQADQVCVGRLHHSPVMYTLNFHSWLWYMVVVPRAFGKVDQAEFARTQKSLACLSFQADEGLFVFQPNEEERSGRLDLPSCISRVRRFVLSNVTHRNPRVEWDGFFVNCTLQQGDIFCSKQEAKSTYAMDSHMEFLALKAVTAGADVSFSRLGRVEINEIILGCQLVRLDDTVHGFVSHTDDSRGSVVRHFGLRCRTDGYEETSSPLGLTLDPPLVSSSGMLVPVATAVASSGILVLFYCGFRDFWLARYSVESSTLCPLGFLPPLPTMTPYEALHYPFCFVGAKA